MKKLIILLLFIPLLNGCNTNPVNSNFDIQKKFINDFQESWNNMDVEAMGNLATVDTVFIDYPTNDIFKVNFKDAGFWNSFFDQYNSLDWKISSINQLNDSLTGLVVKSISNNEMKNGEFSTEKWVMFFYFNSDNSLVSIDEYMK